MWGIIAKLLLGLPGLADGLFGYLKQRSDAGVATNQANVTAEVATNQAALSAYVEERKVAAQVRAADQGSRWTCWMLPTAFAIAICHYGAVSFDSMSFPGHLIGSWHVAKLPTPYDNMEWQILATAVGFSGISRIIAKRRFA